MGLKYNMKSLGEICSMKYGKMPKREDLVDNGGYPVFTGYLISGYHKEYMCKEPEIIVVARGIGGAGDIKMSPPKSWITNISIFLQITDPEVDKSYLYWKLASTGLRHLRTGSAQPQIIIADLKNFIVELPLLQVQRKIAAILSAYDDLIENNLRRIKILEEMAQNLYREWFVNFRFPGHEQTRFVDSPLGRIPEGWKVRNIKDTCNLIMGQSPKSEFYNDIGLGLPFHQGVTNFGNRFPVTKHYCTVTKRIAQKGDILFSVRAPVGRINISDTRLVIGRGLSAISHKKGWQWFLYHYLCDVFKDEDIIGGGTIYKSVTKKDMEEIKILNPQNDTVDYFESIVRPINNLIEALDKKNNSLRQTRDLLLPKLISGEVDVSELDINVPEEVAS
jgi:type I restriction enzyme, S subunit